MKSEPTLNLNKLKTRKFSFGNIFLPFCGLILFMLIMVIVQIGTVFITKADKTNLLDLAENLPQYILQLKPETIHTAIILYSIIQAIILLILMVASKHRGRPYVFKRWPGLANLFFATWLAIGGVGLANILLTVFGFVANYNVEVQKALDTYKTAIGTLSGTGLTNPYLLIIALAVCVPLAEELLFRGLILSEFKLFMPKYLAVFFTALTFALIHVNPVQMVYTFILGMFIGLLYMWTESIFTAIWVHMVFNFIGGVMPIILNFKDEPLDITKVNSANLPYVVFLIVTMVLGIFIFVPVVNIYRRRRPVLTIATASKYDLALQKIELDKINQHQNGSVKPAEDEVVESENTVATAPVPNADEQISSTDADVKTADILSFVPLKPVKAIVLAAGQGKRLDSEQAKLPKVLRQVKGRSLLDYVLSALDFLPHTNTMLVVGFMADQVLATVSEDYRHVYQVEQLGTGHAVACALDFIEAEDADILCCYGDMPLISTSTYQELIQKHQSENNSCTILAYQTDMELSYGRIIRANGNFSAIVEDRDCNEAQKQIKEYNAGVYVFKAAELAKGLKELKNENSQKEYYLTDIPQMIMQNGGQIGIANTKGEYEALGVNTQSDLELIEKVLS